MPQVRRGSAGGTEVKSGLFTNAFEITNLGELRWFYSIEIIRNRTERKIWLSQSDYIDKIAKRFEISTTERPCKTPLPVNYVIAAATEEVEAKVAKAYIERVGSLNWLAMQTRPDIAKALLLLSEHLKAPTKDAFRCADYCIRYLLET
jgi:hypothetical protein